MNSHSTVWVSTSVRLACAFWAVLGASALAPPVAGQNLKLNGPLERYPEGGVLEARQTPDGQRYVYLATEGSQVPGLFSVWIDGRASSTRLLPLGFDFELWEISTDWVVVSDRRDLFIVPIDGSRPPSALLPRDPLRSIRGFAISPDGGRVVVLAILSDGRQELFSARTDADKQPVRISADPSEGSVWSFAISPTGEHVVYRSYQDPPGAIEVFSAPIDGSSPPRRLNPPFVRGRGVETFLISPDGTRVVYRADQDRYTVKEIYSAPIDGSSGAVKLNIFLDGFSDVDQVRISADGAWVVYRADQVTNDVFEVFGVPIDGSSGAVPLNGPLALDEDALLIEIGPDSRTVAFRVQRQYDPVLELHVAPIDGSSAARALQPDPEGPVRFSPDGTRLVYRVDQGVHEDFYSVPVGRGEAINLTPGSSAVYPFDDVLISADSASVVYAEYVNRMTELRKVPLLGGSSPAVLAILESWQHIELSRDGRFAAFRDPIPQHLHEDVHELFSVPLDGHRGKVKLNGPLVTDHIVGDVSSLRVSAQGPVVFAVTVPDRSPDGDSYMELFSVVPGLDPAPIRLSQSPPYIHSYVLDASGQRVVYKASVGESGHHLFSVPSDGHLAPLQLDDPEALHDEFRDFVLSPDGEFAVFEDSGLFAVALDGGPEIALAGRPFTAIRSFEVAPGGERVLFVADGLAPWRMELFSVASDGSAPPVRLNGPLPAGGEVDEEFLVSSDGSTVVALAEQAVNDVRELYRIPVDGSVAPVRLSAPLVSGGDVARGFRIGPDGRTVVYLADQEVDERVELYAVALDGSSSPVKRSGPLADGGDVQPDFAFSPDGARLVYRADAETDERFELFSVALDGPGIPVKLNPLLVDEGDVRPGFVIAPDGSRVIYRADKSEDEKIELFSSPLAGGPTLTLNGALPLGGAVLEALRLGPDGKQVFYVADQRADDVFELFAAPVDQAKRSRLLGGPLPPGGDVGSFEPMSDGKGVVYLADQETDSVVELYYSFLAPPSAVGRVVPTIGSR